MKNGAVPGYGGNVATWFAGGKRPKENRMAQKIGDLLTADGVRLADVEFPLWRG